MAEILLKRLNHSVPDPARDQAGCYKRGHAVCVMPDKHPWGKDEGLPLFVVLKLPGVPVEKVMEYTEPQIDETDPANPIAIRRRRWRLRVDDIPIAIRTKALDSGELIVKAGSYDGPYDVTWQQVKAFIRNEVTRLDETRDL